MNRTFVAILMGSASDSEIMQYCAETLRDFEIPCEQRILSAHRLPEDTATYVEEAEQRGCRLFVAAAGMAAHLAGTVAARSLLPVIGVPLSASSLNGMDALLATVQMPGGVPVATMAIGKAGARNAGFLAAQILALQDPALAQRLRDQRQQQAEQVRRSDAELQRSRRDD